MSGQNMILSDIFERSLSLDRKTDNADRAMSLWEGMARSLEEIAANTRHGLSKKVTGVPGSQTQPTTGKGGAKNRPPSTSKETVLPGRRNKTTSVHGILSTPNAEGQRAAPHKGSTANSTAQVVTGSAKQERLTASPSEHRPESKPTIARPPAVQARDSSEHGLPQEGLLPDSRSGEKPVTSGGSEGKTKSQESLERVKSEAAGKAQAKTIADTLKQNLAKWDGSLMGDGGDVEEAAGLAAGGPVYAAIKEVTGAIESKDEDDGSLIGALRKTIEDKTGVTAAKEKAASAKDGLKSRIQAWAGKQDAADADEKKAKRDKKGRFIRPAPNTAEKEQTELATQSFDLAQRESKESKKRHQELVRAVRSIDAGGGLLDNVLDGWGGRGGRGRDGKSGKPGSRAGLKGGRPRGGANTGRAGSRAGGAGRAAGKGGGRLARLSSRLGGVGSKALGVGAGILGVGSLLGGAGAAEAATGVAARTAPRATVAATTAGAAGKGTGLLGKVGAAGAKAGAIGAKGAMGAAKVIPIAGQLLAVGMAVYDGVQGWNDTEMHQSAFGLAEGEEASTGQKASAAAANVLDMGGLLTGLAGLAGFEIDTADIASGIYTASTAITSTVTEAWGAVGSTISTASATAGAAIAQAWDTASTGISEAASGAWDAITGAATSAWDKTSTAVAEAATGAWDSVTERTAKAWDSASATASSALTTAGNAVSSAWDSTSSTVGGAVASAWDSVSSGASSAWSGLTGFLSGDKPEELPAEKSTVPAAQITQAVAATPATTLLGEKRPDQIHIQQDGKGEKKDEDELGMDAVVVPDEKMEGMFDTLTSAVSELGDTIKDEIKRKELENGGMLSTMSGIVSGVSSWMTNKLSSTGGGSGRSSGAVAQGATGGTSKRYTYAPDAKIGEAIAKYESGTGGSSTIGYDRKGGTSYGKYQLASNAGSMEGFLKMMEGKGGEHAAIAARLRAAGPMNTGSKQGAMPEQWKKEAAANGELLKSAELEYMLKENYAPAMQRLGGDLRGRVEGSKALQEAMFSTAVQHGAYGDAGAAGIWSKVYKEGMSDEELIRAVYNERATRFGSSTPQIQDSARRRMASEQELILSMRRGESSTQSIANAVQSSPQDQAVQAAASAVIQASTQDAVNRGVRYDFGSKNSQKGGIDCSGWVSEVNRNLMEAMNATLGKEVYGEDAKRVLAKGANGGAAGIIQAVSEATGQQLGNAELAPDKVREGMMIGMDTGEKGWDSGRYKGIDHIVQTYRDQATGRMMVSESSSGKGVHSTPYEEWYAKWGEKAKLYGTDVTQLADASKIAPPAQATVTAEAPAVGTATKDATQEAATTPPPGTRRPHYTFTWEEEEEEEAAAAQAASASVVQAVPAVTHATGTPASVAAPMAAAVPNPKPQRVESVGDIAPPENTGSNTLQTAGIEKLLQGILSVLTQQGKSGNAPNGSEGPPHINMDFDDQTALGLAHDRA